MAKQGKKAKTRTKTTTAQPPKKKRSPRCPYSEKDLEMITNFALLSATNEEIAGFLGIHASTFQRRIKAHAALRQALKRGRAVADANIGQRLYQRAYGYSHPDVHICQHQGQVIVTPITKHYPPDTGALAIWMKNRTRAMTNPWKDRHDVNLTVDENIFPEDLLEGVAGYMRKKHLEARSGDDKD